MYEKIKKACLYVRYSSANQTEQSIEGQTRVCKEFCKRHNIKIVDIYADRATSASKDIEKRVNFLRMIKDGEKHKFDAVIVYKLDRFSRSRYDMANFKYRLKKNGVQLISATENISDDPEGIILESVLEGMAEFYSAELSQKIKRGIRESTYKHHVVGGHPPLGYKTIDKKLAINEKTAPIVQEAFKKYSEGQSIPDICRSFNAKGYKTTENNRFTTRFFYSMLRNETYIGVYKVKDYRKENVIPVIIDKELWDKVQNKLSSNYNKPGHFKAKRNYLLSGKLFCGHCGSNMNAKSNGKQNFYYVCYGKRSQRTDCTKKNISASLIEDIVAKDAMSLLTDENIKLIAETAVRANIYELEHKSNIPTLRTRLREINDSLNRMTTAIEMGAAPEAIVKRMLELEEDKKIIEVEIAEEERGIIYLKEEHVIYWLEQFRKGDINDESFKRTVIDLFVNSVTVWDEDDDNLKIVIAYNLSSLPQKIYRIGADSNMVFEHPETSLTSKSHIVSQGTILLRSLIIDKNKKSH